MLESQVLNAPQNDSLQLLLCIWNEGGNLRMITHRLDYRIIKIMCSLEGGYAFQGYYLWHFKGVVKLDSQEQWTGLKNLSLKKLLA